MIKKSLPKYIQDGHQQIEKHRYIIIFYFF